MHFEQYEAEDFLLEESFRNYCLETSKNDVEFWERWIAANPGKSAAVREAKELFRILNGNINSAQFKEDQAAFTSRVSQHIDGSKSAVKRTPFQKIFLYAGLAAASVLLFVFVSKFFTGQDSQLIPDLKYSDIHVSEAGERKSFQLPDGSTVLLNSGSTIKIAENFNTSSREISLQGEAYFDVTRNEQKPFIIHTEAMDIKVLGTIFNVRAYQGDKTAETALIKGAVEVTLHTAGDKKILLQPNQKITAATGQEAKDYVVKEVEFDNADSLVQEVSWTKNRLAFVNNTFEEISVALQRWYGVELIFDNEAIKQFRFTATFDQKNIIQVLDALKLSRPFNYQIEQSNKIRILN